MTREHKLALLVGFSLVLIVGVLISDHFSPARNQEVSAGSMSAGTPVKFGGSAAGLQVPAEPRAIGNLPSALVSEPPIAAKLPEPSGRTTPEPSGTQPLDLVMGGTPEPQVPDPLRGQFDPATGAIGERFAKGNEVPIPGAPTPESALTRQTTTVVPPPVAPIGKPFSTGTVAKHTIREGESVYRLAATHYGDGTLWPRLREFNRNKIGPDGEVRDGVVIEIPPKDVLLGTATLPPAGYVPPRNPANSPVPAKIDSPQKRNGGAATAQSEYVVERGDDLGLVAKKLLGSVRRWPEIAALNRDVLPDPNELQTGMKLRIPAR